MSKLWARFLVWLAFGSVKEPPKELTKQEVAEQMYQMLVPFSHSERVVMLRYVCIEAFRYYPVKFHLHRNPAEQVEQVVNNLQQS